METATAEPARLIPLPQPAPRVAGPSIRVEGDQLILERLVIADAVLARSMADRPPDDRPAFVERALRIGLLALQDASTSVDVDLVRREFETLLERTTRTNEEAAQALQLTLREHFADGEGRLPKTLEQFLGDRSGLRAYVNDLFDESKRDSAIGRMRTLLGSYLEGDDSKLASLLDPTRLGSPLHQFRGEVAAGFEKVFEKLAALEKAAEVRGRERAKQAAKGADFEDLLEPILGEIARGNGDLLDRTGTATGDVMKSKKGDFLLTIDPRQTRGAELRIVIEAKDRAVSGRAMRDELRAAKENRSAAIGVVVFSPAHAPTGIAPFDVRAGDVYCVIDPEAPDAATLEAAVRLARLHALLTLREIERDVDAEAVGTALAGVREQLELVKGLKATLTSMSTSAGDVSRGLDRLREGILAKVAEAEAELRIAESSASPALPA